MAIIGAGTAGLAALREVRKRGRRCVIIDPGPLGTTCARVGCMPSKLLIEPANAFHRRGALKEFGIRGGEGLRPDLPAVLARVRRLRDDFVAGAVGAIRGLEEPLISAQARLLGTNEIAAGDRRIHARSIVIATGSRPIVPAPWQSSFAAQLLTTDTLFEQYDLPACMAVVGAGAIGLELAQALARLGIEIHVFDQADGLPGITDPVVHETLLRRLRSEFSLHLAQHNYGRLRIYADRDTGRLLGAQMCIPAGEHIAHLLALAVAQQLTVDALLGMPFYHPVLEEGLRSALRHAASQLPERALSDLAACEPFGVEALD